MSVTCGFYNSLNGDRRYNAGQMSAIFDGIINDGVFQSIGTAFAVKALSGNTVTVGIGRAWFDHTWTLNDAILPIEADISEVLLDRIDAVVLEVDSNDSVRTNSIKIIKGAPSSNPQNPVMINDEYIHQHPFAYIYRKANSTVITQAEITNVIGTSACPFITGILETMSIDNIIAQWDAQWSQWTDAEKDAFATWRDGEKEAFSTWRDGEQLSFSTWEKEKREAFILWFNELQFILDGNEAARLANAIIRYSQVEQVTLATSKWEAASGLYTQTVAVDTITAEDMPLLLKYVEPNISKESSEDYGIDYAMISGGQCSAGNITFYATDVPSHDIVVGLGLGKKGDGRLLLSGGGSSEKFQYSNVTITILDSSAVAEGGKVTVTCNNKSWESTIRNGKAKLYTSEVGNYTIKAVATDGTDYTTMLTCPYFGAFSTDIYSGTLKVVCTEAGGVGKTCQVRSCDDNYEPTNSYDLTQTFDDKLMLPFPGLPAGKYLITVDGKYVFFKHVESIQYINSVNVELRQWLYRNGDQCLHNTGGWMQCSTEGKPYTGQYVYQGKEWYYGRVSSPGVMDSAVSFADNSIIFEHHISATADFSGYANTSGQRVYSRGGGMANANAGTVKPLPVAISKYSSLKIVTDDNDFTESIRVGMANDENTDISTATVLQSGVGNMDISLGVEYPYFVVKSSSEQLAVNATTSTVSLDYSHTCAMSELYLV